jgi:hypothetical protein
VQIESDDRQHLVAVDEVAVLVDRDHAVGVAVEREPRVRAGGYDRLLKLGGGGRSAAGVDVGAVGLGVQHAHPRPLNAQRPRRDLERGAVATVDDDRLPVEATTAECGGEMGDVVRGRAQTVVRHAHTCALGPDLGARVDETLQLGFDAFLGRVGDLAAAAREELHAIVGIRVVAGGDHRRRRVEQMPQVSDARGRQHADALDVGAFAAQAGDERGLEQRPGAASVAPDEERPVGAEHAGGGAAERGHELGCEIAVGDPAHSVGSKPQRHAAALGIPSASSTAAPCEPS